MMFALFLQQLKPFLFLIFLGLNYSAFAGENILKYALVLKDGYYKAINDKNQIIADSLCTENQSYFALNCTAEPIFPYMKDGYLGFKNHKNEVVVDPVYASYSLVNRGGKHHNNHWDETRFLDGRAIVVTRNKKFGLIDRTGKVIIDTVYDFISEPQDSIYIVRKEEYIKLTDRNGKDILPFYYQTILKFYGQPEFNNGLVPVFTNYRSEEADVSFFGYPTPGSRNYKVGFINTKGKLVIDTIFSFTNENLRDGNDDVRELMNRGAICGTGMQALKNAPPNPDPYYLNSDYYRFEGNRCLVNYRSRSIVINTSGDSLFQVQGYKSVKNTKGFFIVNHTLSFFHRKFLVRTGNNSGQVMV